MRILHVVYNSYPDVTGAAVRTRYLVETQERLGIRPVVLSSPVQAPADPAQARGVEYWKGIPHYRCYDGSDPSRFLAAKPWWERAARVVALPAFARRVAEVARRERADVIHAHNLFFCGLAAAAAGRRLGLPVVYEVRSLVEEGLEGAGAPVRFVWRGLEGLACRLADHVTVLCRGLEGELVRRGVPPGKITVAANGVDTDLHRPLPLARRPDRFVLGFAGTLLAYEGLDLLLEAAARLAPRHPQLRVLLVGGGPARPRLEEQVRRLQLERVVSFGGRVPHEEIPRWYGSVDLFVLPRRASRLTDLVTPLKPLEIMAYGKPLLASDCGGHRELIEDGVNGLLFPAGVDAGALAARIEGLLGDTSALVRLGRQARDWVCRNRRWDQQCRPVLALYERLAAEHAPEVVMVAPAPAAVPTGGVETGVGLLLRTPLARRRRMVVWDRTPAAGPPGIRQAVHFARFAAFLARRRPRVVHVKSSSGVNFWESAVFAALGRTFGRRVLLQLHSGDFGRWYEERSGAGRLAIRRALRLADEVLVLSEYWQDLLEKLAPGLPVRIVPNGVEIPPLSPRPANGSLRVLTIATLGRHKGHFEILEAASQLRGAPVRFVLAGPDFASGRGEGEQVRRRAAEMGLHHGVSFPGPVEAGNKRRLLAEADVFLLPSHAEGMPNAVLEAMAAGLPVVATPVGSLPEMLPGGVLVPVGDPSAIAGALLGLLRDPERRRRLGEENRRRAASLYTLDQVAGALESIYC